MPRPKKTEVEIQATREKILNTTLTILQESGPEAVTSRTIAKRLGMAHMSLFTYFENQADIWSTLRERVISEVRAPFDQITARAQNENIPLLVQEFLSILITFAQEKPYLHRLAWVMPEMKSVSLSANRQETRVVVGQLANILQLGMERGDFENRPPQLAASTVLGMVNLPFILYHSGKLLDENFRDQMVNEVLSAVFLYLEKK